MPVPEFGRLFGVFDEEAIKLTGHNKSLFLTVRGGTFNSTYCRFSFVYRGQVKFSGDLAAVDRVLARFGVLQTIRF